MPSYLDDILHDAPSNAGRTLRFRVGDGVRAGRHEMGRSGHLATSPGLRRIGVVLGAAAIVGLGAGSTLAASTPPTLYACFDAYGNVKLSGENMVSPWRGRAPGVAQHDGARPRPRRGDRFVSGPAGVTGPAVHGPAGATGPTGPGLKASGIRPGGPDDTSTGPGSPR